ncbi:MAG: hypothetical protein ACLS43_07000 [Evtepia gabavorous]
MEGAMPNTPLDREEDKKEIFARVWQRVMGDHTDACPITWEEQGRPGQTTTEQQQTLVTEEAAQTEEKTVLRPPCSPRRPAAPTATFPGRCPGVWGPSVRTARCCQELIRRELADCREYRPSPAGPGRPRPGAGGAGWREEAPGQTALGGLFSHLRVRYWPEGECHR